MLDRAQIATVSGLLGVTVASYLAVVDGPDDPAEPDVFASLTSTHRAAMQADQNFGWCLERFGAEREVLETAAVADRCARRLDAAYEALAESRRRRGRLARAGAPARRAGRARPAGARLRVRGDGLQRAGRAPARAARCLMRLSSGCDVPELVRGPVGQRWVQDVDAAAGECRDGLVVGLSFVAFAAVEGLAVGVAERAER